MRMADTSFSQSSGRVKALINHRRVLMTALIKRARYVFSMLMVLTGLVIWLALPGIPLGRAYTSTSLIKSSKSSQKPLESDLGAARQSALEKLYAQYKAGVA